MFFLIVVSGLRNVATGPDTFAYYRMFNDAVDMDMGKLFDNVKLYFAEGEGKDVGFPLLQKIFSLLFPSHRLFMFFIAIIFYCGVAYMLRDTTRTLIQAIMAVLLFTTLFQPYAISAQRQIFALGLCLISFRYIKERKLLPFLLLVFVGAMVHKSCLIFVPYYWIANIRKVKFLAYGTLLAIPVLYFLATPLTEILVDVSSSDQYAYYLSKDNEAGTPTFTVMLFASFILYLCVLNRFNRYMPEHHFFTNSIYITLALSPVTWVVPDFMRILLYYSMFLPSILAIAITLIPARGMRQVINVAAICLIIYLFVKTIPDYEFFWNNQPLGSNYPIDINTSGL